MNPVEGPAHLKYGGGPTETIVNPAVLVLVVVAGLFICFSSRKRATIAFLISSILIPTDQILLIGAAHFPMLRLLALFGLIRVAKEKWSSKGPLFAGGFNRIDGIVAALSILTLLNAVLLFQMMAAFVAEAGVLLTTFGVYFLLRLLIRDEADVVRAIRTLAYLSIFIAICMSFEFATGHNPYAVLGGARAAEYASLMVRDSRVRAQGPFAHCLLAGTFGAVLVPLFAGLWWRTRNQRGLMVAGMLACTVIVLTSNGSTPMLAYAAGLLALGMWRMRAWMRVLRWSVVILLVSLHIVMKAPVWHLISRIDLAGGSSGYHRFMLIDQCIRHFSDWWLIGVKDTSAWGFDMWDTANQYVGRGESSGLLALLLFIAIFVYGFKRVGKALLAAGAEKKSAIFVWAIGAALFSHAVAYFGITYYDQMIVPWYALLAMISVLQVKKPKKLIPERARTSLAVSSASVSAEEPVSFDARSSRSSESWISNS